MSIKKLTFQDETHYIDVLNYATGNIAVRSVSEYEGPYATISINVVEIPLEEGEFILNHDIRPAYQEALMTSGLFEDTGKKVSYGFIQGQPVWRLK